MLDKNKKKEERRQRAQTFIGCRPARFKSKKEYNRAQEKARAREEQRKPLDRSSLGDFYCALGGLRSRETLIYF